MVLQRPAMLPGCQHLHGQIVEVTGSGQMPCNGSFGQLTPKLAQDHLQVVRTPESLQPLLQFLREQLGRVSQNVRVDDTIIVIRP